TYSYDYLGAGPETLADIVSGKHSFAEVLRGAQKPLIIVGQGALTRADGAAILSLAAHAATSVGAIKDGWTGFA
ncbi:molybdopterin-dependent oxidoreductase, partial [Acinetobacter baumannii]|uniref:molybdopterin-dependent oxidoreductase n=1 Tax=Acinetobacter baumannii TaxID=470 RepID=UPI001C096BDF